LPIASHGLFGSDDGREAAHPEAGRRPELLTIFSPGGFDRYLEDLLVLTEAQYADVAFMKGLSERYDIFDA